MGLFKLPTKIEIALFLLFIPTIVFAQPAGKGIVSIADEDLSPQIFPWQIKVTNGTLTDNGDGTASLSISGTGAPTDADYLVGTSNGSLSAEIVVGTAPQGELGGTWGSPTIDQGTLPVRISAFTSSTLRSNLFDSTGTGSAVFNNTPTITDTTLKNTFIFEQTGGTDVVTGGTGGILISGTQRTTGSISFSKYNCSAFANGGVLTTDGSGGVLCADDDSGAAGTSGWTDNGTDVNLTTSTDNVGIGGSSLGKLSVDGDTDEIQFLVQGNSTQTSNLFVLEKSDGTDTITSTTTGMLISHPLVVNSNVSSGSSISNGLTVSGYIQSSATNDMGWSIVDQTDNQACNTGCTSACVFGIANATGSAVTNLVSCTDTSADLCVCAGAS